jgi:tetratricopeptide (TPR) repeat protein
MSRPSKLDGLKIFAVVGLFLAGCWSRPEFEPTAVSSWSAMSSGKLTDSLRAYELRAAEAERQANESVFPLPYWNEATENYYYASRAARYSGDLQKSIIYAERALDAAEKTEEPRRVLGAIQQLIWAYEAVKLFEKADVLLQKGLAVVKQVPSNTAIRANWEGILNHELGRSLARKKDYAGALEAYAVAISWNRSWIAGLRRRSADLKVAQSNIINILNAMGIAYRRSGQLELAMEQYREAFDSIQQWGLTYPYENSLHAGMGEIFIQHRQFPDALASFQKALAVAESQRRPEAISSASARIAYILRQMGKPGEAKVYAQRAAEQKQAIRSLMLSPENSY